MADTTFDDFNYVEIGGYNINSSTYKTFIVIAIIIVILIITTIIVLGVWFVESRRAPLINDSSTNNQPTTFLELGNIITKPLKVEQVDSFDLCWRKCTYDSECGGVAFENGICHSYPKIIHRNNLKGTKKFKATDNTRVINDDKIHIAYTLPLDYWYDNPYGINIDPNTIVRLHFFPHHAIVPPGYVGYYSRHLFNPADLKNLVVSNTVWVHHDGMDLKLPVSWKGAKLWVYYKRIN